MIRKSIFYIALFLFSIIGSSYLYQTQKACTIAVDNTDFMRINCVDFGSISHVDNGLNGYNDFSFTSTTLEKGSMEELAIALYKKANYPVHVAVWIDWNEDDVFDVTEQVFASEKTTQATIKTSVKVGESVPVGKKRMRIALRYNDLPVSCGGYEYGEVEDYTVTIVEKNTINLNTPDDDWEIHNGFIQSKVDHKVVIGNVAPVGDYQAFIEGGILTEKVKVALQSTADWSDTVFEEGYDLKSLDYVDCFIEEHGHLPNVPSAEEVVREGIDMATMDAKLLEKIEELTLYMIDLKQENKALKTRLDRMEKR